MNAKKLKFFIMSDLMFLKSVCLQLIWLKFISSTVKLPDWGNPLFWVLISCSRGGICLSFRLKTVIRVDVLSWFSVFITASFLLIPLNGVNQEKVGKLIPNCIQSQNHWSPFSLHIIYDFKDFHCQGQLYKFMHFHAKSYFALFSCNLSFSILKPKCLVQGKKW